MMIQKGRGNIGFAVYIGNLNLEATEEDLMKAFSPYGEIISTKVIRYPPEHVVSKGYGKVAIKGSFVAIQMGGRRKPGIDSHLAATAMVTPSPYSHNTQYFQDPSTGQLYMMPQYAGAVTSGMPTMPATYPVIQPMYYQQYQQPMQMMTIAPTMPQMAFQQRAPQVTVGFASKQAAIASTPGVLQTAGNKQMSLTMSAIAPQAAMQQPPPPPQALPTQLLLGQAQLGTLQPVPHSEQPPPSQLPTYPSVQSAIREPTPSSHVQPDKAQPNPVQGHPVQPSPPNNRPPFPNRSSPLPNHPPTTLSPQQPRNHMRGAVSTSGIANGKQSIQRFSPY